MALGYKRVTVNVKSCGFDSHSKKLNIENLHLSVLVARCFHNSEESTGYSVKLKKKMYTRFDNLNLHYLSHNNYCHVSLQCQLRSFVIHRG